MGRERSAFHRGPESFPSNEGRIHLRRPTLSLSFFACNSAADHTCTDAPSLRRNCAAGPPPLTSDCEGRIIAWSIRIGGHVMGKSLRHPIYLGFLGSGGIL